MNARFLSVARVGVGSALLLALSGCVTYGERPVTRTVYVTPQPAPQPEPAPVYAPQPEPAPVYAPQPEAAPVYVPPPAPAAVVIQSESDFYEPLSPYGEWVVVAGYGRCWRPIHVETGWRPYGNGHWRRTDAGWYWASAEPWGWATYHYGRWDWAVGYGWIWIPQTQWAPAWVCWREGAGYVGWAPLPPSARISISGSIEFGNVAPRFVFVEERHLLEPVRPTTVIVNNTTVINKTKNITRIKVVNKNVINEGPRTEIVEHVSGRKIESVPASDLRHREENDFTERRRSAPAAGAAATQTPRSVSPEPAKGVLPRREVQAPAQTVATPPTVQSPTVHLPTAADRRVRDIGEQERINPSARPEVRGTVGNEHKTEAAPVVVKSDPPRERVAATPVNPRARMSRPAQSTAPVRVTAPETKPDPRLAAPTPEARQIERPNNPGNGRGEVVRTASAPAPEKQIEKRIKSPKAAAAAAEQHGPDNKKKEQKKSGQSDTEK